MAGHDEVCCGAVGRMFREYPASYCSPVMQSYRLVCLRGLSVCFSLPPIREQHLDVDEPQRRVTACSTLHAVSLASRIHDVQAALVVDDTRQVLCFAFATELSDYLRCPSRSSTDLRSHILPLDNGSVL